MTSPINLRRARSAETTIVELCVSTGSTMDDAVTDLLTDLMHWAKLTGRDFERSLDAARMHFSEEVLP